MSYLIDMIALPNLIPAEHRNALSLAITRGDAARVKYLMEEHALDANAFLDDCPTCMPVLMDALLSYGFQTEEERLPLLRYLLEKGANPNICCRKGYNCLHVAVQQDKYIRALDLLLDYNADVNVPDADGANIVYWAVQGFLLRGAAADRAEHLRVLEKILRLGADLDQRTRYDMNAREWLQHAAPEVRALVDRCQSEHLAVRPATTVQPRFPTHLQYPGVARKIWNEAGLPGAPPPAAAHGLSDARTLRSGPTTSTGPTAFTDPAASSNPTARPDPATSLSRRLLHAVETLREEAQRHNNAGYRRQHKRLALFVRDTLVKSGCFDETAVRQIRSATETLMKPSPPYKEDDLYDALVDRICLYYTRKSAPVPVPAL